MAIEQHVEKATPEVGTDTPDLPKEKAMFLPVGAAQSCRCIHAIPSSDLQPTPTMTQATEKAISEYALALIYC